MKIYCLSQERMIKWEKFIKLLAQLLIKFTLEKQKLILKKDGNNIVMLLFYSLTKITIFLFIEQLENMVLKIFLL